MTKSSRTRRTTGGQPGRPPTSRTGPWWQRTLSKIQNGPGQPQMGGLALLILGAWGMAALLGDLTGHALWRQMCGWGAYPLAVALLAGGLFLLFGGAARQLWRWWLLVGLETAWLGALTMTQLAGAGDNPQAWAQGPGDGGMVGWIIGDLLRRVFGLGGTWIAAILAIVAGLGLIWFFLPAQVTAPLAAGGSSLWRAAAEGVLDRIPPAGVPADDDEPAELAAVPASRRSIAAPSIAAGPPGADKLSVPPAEPPAKPRRRSSAPAQSAPASAISPQPRPQSLPSLDLLVPDKVVEITDTAAREKGSLIERTLASFGVPVEVVEVNIGPTVTQFGVKPLTTGSAAQQRRVRVSRILALSNDLALALAAPAIRIEAPVPGRPFVGIEVPNGDTTLVTLRGILEAPRFQQIRSPLAIALGRDVSGAPAVADLTRMPHLLVAGATGAGKSVCLNAIVVSLLLNNGPDRLRFLMIDPKMVEMVGYNGIPHLLAPVVIDLKQVVGALVWMTLQMDERYRRFNAAGVRNLEAYNKKVARRTGDDGPLPYLVLIVDELADLMMTAPEDIEKYICRLAQMARATGIHLIIATQRPSVDVVTGLIKANFPARIAFAVTSGVDSRVVLDQPGAEKLLGRGDMLFMSPESSKLQRIQGCFVSDREIRAVVDFWHKSDFEKPSVAESLAPWAGILDAMEEKDDLLEQALRELKSTPRASASMLQRRLRIGFARAAQLMQQLEEMGVVGPDEGGGRPRRVLLPQKDGEDRADLLFEE